MPNVKLSNNEIKSLTARFYRAMSVSKHRQKEVIMLTGIPQYQVSKVLNGQFKTLNISVLKICNYADMVLGPKTRATKIIEEKLIASVLDLWDGSVIDGEGIVGLLERLKKYRENAIHQSG